ncbi:MAG TPA: TolC family protein [Candidatus Polarisedimenticolaceae bacterium]|nr:TolC family protein [Candidatus Polarisedimenticolaceae bacterium]
MIRTGTAAFVAVSILTAAAAAPPPELTVGQVVIRALELSPELAVLRDEPAAFETLAAEERALFDPLLSVALGHERVAGRDLSASGRLFDYNTDSPVAELWLTTLLPIGTTLELGATNLVEDASADGQQLVEARLRASIRQPLLRGVRPSVNRGRVRAARQEAEGARHEAQAAAATLAAEVEQACWDLILAREQIAVLEAAEAQARELRESVRERVGSGITARDQIVAAESEIALRRQDLSEARTLLDVSTAVVVGYIGPLDAGGALELRIVDPLAAPAGVIGAVDALVESALRDRPELARARVLAQRGEDEVDRTRGLLLPQVDLWADASLLGYGDTSRQAWDDLDGRYWSVAAGLAFERVLGNRDDRADHRRELVRRRQAVNTVAGLERLVETEVRVAHAQARRSLDFIAAVTATRALDEQKLVVEQVRFELGQASAFQVARAQRDLVERRLDELTAIAESHKALVELERAAGRLLERHGLAVEPAPGTTETGPR